MTNPQAIVITGFLGAGKSTLARHLSETGAGAIEVDGLKTPAADVALQRMKPRAVLAIIDAANFTATQSDPLISDLIRAQIAAADALVVTRSDATAAEPTVQALRKLTDAPVLVEPYGQIDPGDIPAHAATGPALDLTTKFETWEHASPITLKTEQAEALLEKRPRGIYRIHGQVRTDTGGLDLQLIGRVRQITRIDRPIETRLHAVGPKSAFKRFDMDVAFSEYASASAHLSGLFSHR